MTDVVSATEGSVDRVTLVICALDTFPLMGKSIFEPAFVVASIIVRIGVGVGDAVDDGIGFGVGEVVSVGVDIAVGG